MTTSLTVRISEKRHELSQGNNCRIVYFGLNGDPRTPKASTWTVSTSMAPRDTGRRNSFNRGLHGFRGSSAEQCSAVFSYPCHFNAA